MTPISSLQNVLAVSYLEQIGISVSFGSWILLSLPFCVVCTLLCWVLIILVVKPDDVDMIPIIVYERSNNVFGKRNIAVILLSLMTILLFATNSGSHSAFGDIGVIALCFVFVMFGTGILSEVRAFSYLFVLCVSNYFCFDSLI